MKQEEAERLARKLRPDDTDEGLHYDDFRALCDYILSGDMKREIENAAYWKAAKRARDEIEPDDNVPDAILLALPADAALAAVRATKKSIEAGILALIQPPAQKENE